MIKFYRLFDLLNRRGMKKTDLYAVLTMPTVAKLSKHEPVNLETVSRLCKFLNCQPGDIMEYVPEEKEGGTNRNRTSGGEKEE